MTPRDEQDYYRIGFWLVSKRLAFLITVIVCVASLWCIVQSLPVSLGSTEKGVPVFRYNSLPLKFYKGEAKVLAKSGYTAYIGHVDRGAAQGRGTLYTKEGNVLYKGQFSGNEYHGKGTLYRDNGTKVYAGAFDYGVRQGKGKLYNAGEELIYAGSFRNNEIVYEELAGTATEKVADRYTGQQILYEMDDAVCVAMPEIHALYSVRSGEDSVDGLWETTGVYVMAEAFAADDGKLRTVKELKEYFETLQYEGETILQFEDAAAMQQLAGPVKKKYGIETAIETEGELADARKVTGYTRNIECYIYTFEKDGFRYTFFSYAKNSGFGLYLIEKDDRAGKGEG